MIPLKPSAIFVLISASLLGGDLPSLAADVPPDITVPRGFVIERIAAPPVVEHPMMACFDDRIGNVTDETPMREASQALPGLGVG